MTALLLGSISAVADTSEIQREAFNRAFAEHGLDWRWDREDYQRMLSGNGGRDRVADYAAEQGEEVDADAVHATKSRLFQESLGEGVSARSGVAETVAAARSSGVRCSAAHRAIANSGCRVASPPETWLWSSRSTRPSAATRTEPKGSSPASSARSARSTARSRCPRSAASIMWASWHSGFDAGRCRRRGRMAP